MKNDNLYQELKSAKKDYRIACVKENELKLKRKKELEEAVRPIIEKYKQILNVVENETGNNYEKIWQIGGLLRDYSTYPRYIIVHLFSAFLTYIEGEKYVPFCSSELSSNSIIMKEELANEYLDINYETYNTLYNNGDLIMLYDYSNMVNFYNNIGEPCYRFGKFYYLHEFINRLTQYRIDNNKKDTMSGEELHSFMCNYILTHPELANKNKEKRKIMMNQKYEDKIISQCKKLEKVYEENTNK